MPNANHFTASNQRAMILQLLKSHPSLNTMQFRALGCCSPAPRIFVLRYSGIKIESIKEVAADSRGVRHRNVARYWLAETPDSGLEARALSGRKAHPAKAEQL